MTDTAVTVDTKAPTTPRARLPPGVRLPKPCRASYGRLPPLDRAKQRSKRYGDVFAMNLPVFGRTVIVADPQLAKQLFIASTDDVSNMQPNLSRIFGPGSVFALDGTDHRPAASC